MNNKKIEEIKREAYEKLPILLGKEGKVTFHNIEKNNGQILTGICFKPDGSNMGPTVYAEYFLDQKPEEAVKKIAEIIGQHLIEGDFDTEQYFTDENIRKNLMIRLVNKDRNTELLKNVPYRTVWGDLAEYMILKISMPENSKAEVSSIKITNRLMESGYIDLSIDEMFAVAHENTKKEFKIMDFCDYMSEKTGDDLSELLPGGYMSIISNGQNFYGASVILDNLDRFGNDYYIIPSSIHELIVIPGNTEDTTAADLDGMISCVNDTSLLPEEILSDHSYHVVNGEVIPDGKAA